MDSAYVDKQGEHGDIKGDHDDKQGEHIDIKGDQC